MTVKASVDLRTDIRPGDFGAVVAFQGREYAEQYGLDWRFEAHVAEAVGAFAHALAEDPDAGRMWLAEDDGELVGCVAVTREGGRRARLRWVLVSRHARGRGIGRQLLAEALAYARERFDAIDLVTFSELTTAAHMYLSSGFELIESRPQNDWGREIELRRYELRFD
jgi:GNAT superfamily N-acetyltransferase